jgi:acyl CoA:acetate/3-ketoacid CoA transferase alpha subunit
MTERGRRSVALLSVGFGRDRHGANMKTIAIDQAVELIPHGASLMIGGFMGVGTPERVVDEIVRQGKRELTVIANDTASPGVGIGKLVGAKALRKVIASHIGLNPETQKQMIAGELRVELVPQGTLIERIRAGGCGLGGVLTPTGVGTASRKVSSASWWTESRTSSRPRCAPISPSSMRSSPIISGICRTR